MPAQLLSVVLRRPSGMYDSNSTSLLKVCTVNTHGLEDSQWLVGCGGCGLVSGAWRLFIHKPGGNCKWKHRHLPADTFNDHIVLFFCKRAAGRGGCASAASTMRFVFLWEGKYNLNSNMKTNIRGEMQDHLCDQTSKRMIKLDMKLDVAKTDVILAQSIHLHGSHLANDRGYHKIWAFMSCYTR